VSTDPQQRQNFLTSRQKVEPLDPGPSVGWIVGHDHLCFYSVWLPCFSFGDCGLGVSQSWLGALRKGDDHTSLVLMSFISAKKCYFKYVIHWTNVWDWPLGKLPDCSVLSGAGLDGWVRPS
jgi:hypothetical protein